MARAHASAPGPVRPNRRRAGSIGRGLLAAAALAVLVVGFPVLLVWLVGNPLPTSVNLDRFGEEISTEVLINVLAIGCWLMWAQFTVAVYLELRTALARRDIAPRLPLGSATQALAHRLVAAVLATGTVGAGLAVATWTELPAAPAAATTAIAAPMAGSGVVAVAADAATVAPAGVQCRLYTVHRLDTLWRIAEQCLGDGLRYREIAELNRGRTQPDGRTLVEEDLIYPGWVLAVPTSDADPEPDGLTPIASGQPITVHPGDTLWDLTASLLGPQASNADIAAAWPELYTANLDVIGGDPDLIQPGQRLAIPDGLLPAAPAGEQPSAGPDDEQPPAESPEPSTDVTATPTSESPAETPASPGEGRPALVAPPAASRAEPPPAITPSPIASQPPVTVPADIAEDADESAPQLWRIAGFGALAAGAVIAALSLKRLIQQRRRLPGHRIRMPAEEITGFELLAWASADPAAADRLDRALRSLARSAHETGHTLPEIRLVRAHESGIQLYLSGPAAPIEPFGPTTDPSVWHCDPDTALLGPEQCADQPAPYPALVTVGHDADGGQILVDLEHARELSLVGESADTVAALRALAVELTAARLADDLAVTCVGFGHELAATGLAEAPRLTIHDDLDQALTDLAVWARLEGDALSSRGLTGPRHARARRVALDLWTPHILLIATPIGAEQARRLAGLLTAVPATTAVAVTGEPVTERAWTIPARSGPAPLHDTGLEITVQRLDDGAYQQLIHHLEVANQPATSGAEWWPATAPAAPATEAAPSVAAAPAREAEPAAAAAPAAEAQTDAAQVDTVPARLSAAAALIRSGDGTVAAGDSADAASEHPQLRVLGPVEVTGAHGPIESGKRARLTELVTYLALCPSDTHEAFTAALWPAGTTSNNRNAYVSKVRRWLGAQYLPDVDDSGYRLDPRVGCDYLTARILIRRGLHRGHPDGDRDLAVALRLIRGVPFSIPPGSKARYAWAEPLRQKAISLIIDAATTLGQHCLGVGDPAGAEAAAGAGLLAAPEAEQLWRLRFRALHHLGDLDGLDQAVTQLENHNELRGLDYEPETLALLDQLLRGHHAVV